ncbi:WD repeat-containing protein 89 [Pseudochaenichthys georgianus]|uniref:WD repeat-containing protein 89 n=1 Tax=Pseudochaenichthys georgianus TaxID=52239 RepID=UPI00146C9755|nr:WD repeat-containing protein 89 [Pseudochaenichthys georgianus]XP_033967527.1 WD repeat-containing protein 89 [Pseudochaenichthys georgianus]XP_033967529.1 WD repeat-containing protein 89 [Pseudochaenichthys georgianus]
MEGLEEKLKGLSLARRSLPEEPTYLLDVALQPAGLLAVSCSNFTIHLHNKDTLSLVGQYQGHSGPLCGVVFSHTSPDSLYSGSADGTVRGWDVRRPGSEAVQVFKSGPSHNYCSFDLNSSDTLLCAGTEQVNDEDSFLVFWDVRKPGGKLLGVYSESHSDDITQVCFHPREKDRLASGSTDGLVNVFDLSRGGEDEALLATCNSDSSAGSVCWSGAEFTQLLCLSHDEGLHLWDLGQLDTDEPLTIFSTSDARGLPLLADGGGVDYLVGCRWLQEAQRLLVVGGKNSGDLHLMECDHAGLRLLRTLEGGHSSTVRCFLWDAVGEALFTGGEDAQLLLWKPGGEELMSGKRKSKKSESALRLKSRPHKKHGYQREKKGA